MNRSHWLRLAYIAAWMLLVFGLIQLAFWAGWPVAFGVSAGGLVLATLAAEDWSELASSEVEESEPLVSGRAQRRELLRSRRVEVNGE